MSAQFRPSPTWLIALRTLIVAILFTAFWVGALLVAHHLDGPRALPDWMVPAGFIITGVGAVLCLMCVVTFTVTGRGTPTPFDPPREFVVTGPYRYCRNPMLLGFCIMLAGLALFMRSPASLAFAAFAVLCGHLTVTLWEERHLRGKFGQPYIDYCRRVPRWLPRF